MCFGHFAYVGIEFCTGNVVPSASLEYWLKKRRNVQTCLSQHGGTLVELAFVSPYLVQHLNAVFTEPVVVVGFPRGPVSEGGHVFIRPAEQTGHSQVIQTSPDITGGCKKKSRAVK